MKYLLSVPVNMLMVAGLCASAAGVYVVVESFSNRASSGLVTFESPVLPTENNNALLAERIHEPAMPDTIFPVAQQPKVNEEQPPIVEKKAQTTLRVVAKKQDNSVALDAAWRPHEPDCLEAPDAYPCFGKYYAAFTKAEGPTVAMAHMRKRYEEGNSFYVSQCHQLTHMVGRAAADLYVTVGEAYRHGDSFCWSGYYHGVMEGVLAALGPAVLDNPDAVCADLPGKASYSFDYYNCVHGLGHGLMFIFDDELFKVLEYCAKLTGIWEQQSCYGGSFMENIIADEVNHQAKYLRADDPHYPCNAAAEKYKSTCYLMQTSRMLTLAGGDFTKVFEECKGAGVAFIDICYQSLGRDASGRSVSNVSKTRETCMLGPDEQARAACVRGAAMDFVSYHHSDLQAREFCASLVSELQGGCYVTVENYYRRFQ